MAYGRNAYGSGLYGAYPLDVVTDLAAMSTATSSSAATLVVSPTLSSTTTATAVSTASIAAVLALSGTSDFTFVASGNIRQVVPTSPVPSGRTTTPIKRVSPIMPDPVIVDGKPT